VRATLGINKPLSVNFISNPADASTVKLLLPIPTFCAFILAITNVTNIKIENNFPSYIMFFGFHIYY